MYQIKVARRDKGTGMIHHEVDGQSDIVYRDIRAGLVWPYQTQPGYWRPLYIGQTSSLADRLADHEREACAKRNGATHIHAHTSSDSEQVRRDEETDLIDKWDPVCNK